MDDREPSLRDRQRVQVVADIRRAAYRLFVERGFDAVTTGEIAAAAGVSQRTLFRHISTKEDLVLGPVSGGGSAIVHLLQQRPPSEKADLALRNAIVHRAEAFDETDSEEWRKVVLATDLLDRATLLTATDRERVVKLTADRLPSDPGTQARAGLLVQLAFAAADFGFQEWVKQPSEHTMSLADHVTAALRAVTSPRWSRPDQGRG